MSCSDDEGVEGCLRSSDCSDPHHICTDGICQAECGDSRDCAPGWFCSAGSCVEPVNNCVIDADCPWDQACAAGVCGALEGGCASDSECASGEECVGGSCRDVARANRRYCFQVTSSFPMQ